MAVQRNRSLIFGPDPDTVCLYSYRPGAKRAMKNWIRRMVRRALHIETAKSAPHDRQYDLVRALYAPRPRFPATYDRPAYLRRQRAVMCD